MVYWLVVVRLGIKWLEVDRIMVKGLGIRVYIVYWLMG